MRGWLLTHTCTHSHRRHHHHLPQIQAEEEAAEAARALGEARVALENTRELLKEKDARVGVSCVM